jgi:hypothetical protein
LNAPFIADDLHTARTSLSERAYWSHSEAHAVLEVSYIGPTLSIETGLSAAVMRPLGSSAINDASQRRGTISLLTYNKARAFSGNAPIFGAKVGAALGEWSALIFGYFGELASEGGLDELRNRIAGFALLPGYDAEDPHAQSSSAWWGGLRINGKLGGLHVRLEGLRSRESLLFRNILSGQLGYIWDLGSSTLPQTIGLRLRGERYRIEGADDALSSTRSLRSPDPSQAISWDYDVVTIAFASRLYRRLLWARIEHTLIREMNGSRALGRANSSVKNDETTLGLELRF